MTHVWCSTMVNHDSRWLSVVDGWVSINATNSSKGNNSNSDTPWHTPSCLCMPFNIFQPLCHGLFGDNDVCVCVCVHLKWYCMYLPVVCNPSIHETRYLHMYVYMYIIYKLIWLYGCLFAFNCTSIYRGREREREQRGRDRRTQRERETVSWSFRESASHADVNI